MKRHIGSTVARIALGGVFIAAGWAKATRIGAFAETFTQYRLLPEDGGSWGLRLSAVAVAALPWIEIFAGGALITGVARRGALFVATLLLAAFALAKASVAWRGLEVTACGCFGEARSVLDSTGAPGMAAPLALLAVALLLLRGTRREEVLSRETVRPA